ncbi:MAG: DivIVA domain-containing protein [Actinobacteria bacterium]|nr:MAG: DivIVA domain-containing protein [Actinomycetota bacterium]
MAVVDLDRQRIERRDFPVSRRGYDPAAVDAHLRDLADAFQERERQLAASGPPSLAAEASAQVQSILAAAEAAAADIERQALESATAEREQAARDAARTREEAIEHARSHVAAVSDAASALLERVGSMDAEVGSLLESVRASAARLGSELRAVDVNMGELYDAASGRAREATDAVAKSEPTAPAKGTPLPGPPTGPAFPEPPTPSAPSKSAAARTARGSSARRATRAPARDSGAGEGGGESGAGDEGAEGGDLDSARLVALNMALNGESRASTDRYLAENFRLAERQKLIDEVYAAIEA